MHTSISASEASEEPRMMMRELLTDRSQTGLTRYIYIYIYIYRERERERKIGRYTRTFIDRSYTKGARAHTHRELIREWLWEPKGSSLVNI